MAPLVLPQILDKFVLSPADLAVKSQGNNEYDGKQAEENPRYDDQLFAIYVEH